MEYTISGFMPVILASVTATSLSRAVFGSAPAFDVPPLELLSIWELPLTLVLGAAVGAAGAGFTWSVRAVDVRLRNVPLIARTTIAGLVTGICALAVPEVMGIGYDTVGAALLGEVALASLLAIALLKFVATVACAGLGSPGGLIGPLLVIGASVGGVFAGGLLHSLASLSESEFSVDVAEVGLYVMLGMGAMMGAALQAPLAALMAILELTGNPNIILPGMLAIIAATITARELFTQDSVFIAILAARGFEYRHDPVTVSLSRTGVSAVMNRRIAFLPGNVAASTLQAAIDRGPNWILAVDGEKVVAALPAEIAGQLLQDGLKRANEIAAQATAGTHTNALLESATASGAGQSSAADRIVESVVGPANSNTDPDRGSRETGVATEPRNDPDIDIASAADNLGAFCTVRNHASLSDAQDQLDAEKRDIVLITRDSVATRAGIYGVLTRDRIQSSVRYQH